MSKNANNKTYRSRTYLNDTAFPLAEASGNCVTFLDNAGNVQAHYVYDAFGRTVSDSGDMPDDFRFRFSSKYLDDETGLYYYGYRYYDPVAGRWLNRDPILDKGFDCLRQASWFTDPIKLKLIHIRNYLEAKEYSEAEINEMLSNILTMHQSNSLQGSPYCFVYNSPCDLFDPLGDKTPEWLKKLWVQIKNAFSTACPAPGSQLAGAAECGPGLTYLAKMAQLQELLFEALENGDYAKVEELENQIMGLKNKVIDDAKECAKENCCPKNNKGDKSENEK